MKILAKPIDVIVVFKKSGMPQPYKFKIEENGQVQSVKIDKILKIDKAKIAGIPTIIYLCQSYINGANKLYELKYIIDKYSWELYKI